MNFSGVETKVIVKLGNFLSFLIDYEMSFSILTLKVLELLFIHLLMAFSSIGSSLNNRS